MGGPESQQSTEAARQEQTEEAEFSPVGTMAVMAILAAVILGLWLFVYFAVYITRGPLS